VHVSIYFYPKNRRILVPSSATTTVGLGMEIEPFEVAQLDDIHASVLAIERAFARGCRLIPHPARNAWPKVTFHKYVGARTMSDFEREADLWDLNERPEGGFDIQRWMSPPRERG